VRKKVQSSQKARCLINNLIRNVYVKKHNEIFAAKTLRRHVTLTETIDRWLADAASELTSFLRLESVSVASAAAVDKLKTAISWSVVVPD